MATEALTWANGDANTRPLVDRLHGWVTTVDHKGLDLMYVAYALLFLGIGGIEAAMMRIQLIAPQQHFVSPQVFNPLFTMHGTTMIFFVMMPLLFGFANYLIPLMIGARDMAFPRVNALSFWLTAFGALLLYFSVLGANGLYGAGNAPDVGWFAYAPLTSTTFSPGHSTDYWTLAVLVSGFGSIGTAINLIATIMCLRRPGMTLGRMPLFAWLMTSDLAAFHLQAFLTAIVIHLITSLLVGLLYGAMLPVLARRPILLGGVVAPVFWSGLLHGILNIVNPVLQSRISRRHCPAMPFQRFSSFATAWSTDTISPNIGSSVCLRSQTSRPPARSCGCRSHSSI